jgi:peptidylprolyl isomerase
MIKRYSKFIVFVVAGFATIGLGGCGGNNNSNTNNSSTNDKLPVVSDSIGTAPTLDWSKVTADAPKTLTSEYIKEGTGAVVKKGQSVTVNYQLNLWKGNDVVDSSFTQGRTPFSFSVGAGQVIAGWDTGVAGKKIGSRILLVVPPELGYGAQSVPGIPANSTLVFVIDIISAK